MNFERQLWISGCLALALIPHLGALPFWVLVTIGASGGIRLLLAARGRDAPPRVLRLLLSALAIGLLFLHYRTFNGLAAGTALLSLVAGLKLLETQTRRDLFVTALIIYFLSLAALLATDSFWLLGYTMGVCWLTTATLLRSTRATVAPDWHQSLRYAARILAQALPLALVLWLLFPRFSAPLWPISNDGHRAGSGLSDAMSPGDISELALSDEVAFRVHFISTVPPPRERYWRGPVLSEFDGHTWRASDQALGGAPVLLTQGPAYRYTIGLEPHRHNWIYALDWPTRWDLPGGILTADYLLIQPGPVSHPINILLTSYGQSHAAGPLSQMLRRRDTELPLGRNPRTQRLSMELRRSHRDDLDYVRSVLDMFRQQAFFYTLSPPKLADNSVDEFLFDTKRGFCGHYASAFAALMRAAGIPARVVTGYQGGTFNRFADYWILRQSDAHAWDEIWIESQGWLRIDPTASIAPERVEHDLGDTVGADETLVSRWQHRTAWFADTRLRFDALEQLWRDRVLNFNQGSQEKLLGLLLIRAPDTQKLVLVLSACLSLVLCWLTWVVRRELKPRTRDELSRAFERLCTKLAAAGMPRSGHEGAEAYAARIAALRPDLAGAVTALCRHYTALRYGARNPRITVEKFNAAVRAWKAR